MHPTPYPTKSYNRTHQEAVLRHCKVLRQLTDAQCSEINISHTHVFYWRQDYVSKCVVPRFLPTCCMSDARALSDNETTTTSAGQKLPKPRTAIIITNQHQYEGNRRSAQHFYTTDNMRSIGDMYACRGLSRDFLFTILSQLSSVECAHAERVLLLR